MEKLHIQFRYMGSPKIVMLTNTFMIILMVFVNFSSLPSSTILSIYVFILICLSFIIYELFQKKLETIETGSNFIEIKTNAILEKDILIDTKAIRKTKTHKNKLTNRKSILLYTEEKVYWIPLSLGYQEYDFEKKKVSLFVEKAQAFLEEAVKNNKKCHPEKYPYDYRLEKEKFIIFKSHQGEFSDLNDVIDIIRQYEKKQGKLRIFVESGSRLKELGSLLKEEEISKLFDSDQC